MGGNDGYKTKSSLSKYEKPVASAMFDIFKANLGGQLPAYPGSGGMGAFSPQGVQKTFRASIGGPMQNLWNDKFAGLIGPSVQKYATGRQAETMASLSSQMARMGEQQAYSEWLRTQPETSEAMGMGMAYLGTPTTATYIPERSDMPLAYSLMSGVNTLAQGAMYQSQISKLNDPYAAVRNNPWGGGIGAGYSPWMYGRNF